MRLLVTLLSVCAALHQGTGSTLDERIYGGIEARHEDVPWQAVLKYYANGMTKKCGGSILNGLWIVTAAHCVADFHSGQEYTVGVGLLDFRDMEKKENQRTIKKVFIHPDRKDTFNDIAMIRMNEVIYFNKHVQPIKIPDVDANFEARTCIASGWGENDKAATNKLLMVPLEIVSDASCKKAWHTHYDIKTHICAGESTPERSVCNGDSGGPLACKVNHIYYLAGVTSFGGFDCPNPVPDVFSRTSAFKTWIEEIIRKHSYD